MQSLSSSSRLLACGLLVLALAGTACGAGRGAAAQATAPASATPLPATTPTPADTAPASTATPAPAPPSPVPSPACTTAGVVSSWSLERLAEQTVVVPVSETEVASVAPEVAAGAGGVILFGSQAPTDLGASLAALNSHAPGGVVPLVMTDEEGGVIQRMANLVGDLPSARQMGATMTPAQIQALASQVGRGMRAAGITMDLAPVLDLDAGAGPSNTDPDGTRSFSLDPAIAGADGLAFAAGLQAAGVLPVAKHFPGLGSSTGNTDVVAAATLPWTTLQGAGLLPFASAVHSGIPAIMVANATVPGLTSLPASLSPTVIDDVLRTRLGFTGLVLTDSLSAVSVSAAGYSIPRASATAIAAGADMVMFNGDPAAVPGITAQTVQAIVAAVQSGSLSRSRLENAVQHILAAKHITLCA